MAGTGIAMPMAYMLGGVISRVFGPIAEDLYKHHTSLGRRMVEHEYEKKEKDFEVEMSHRRVILEDDYKIYLQKQAEEFKTKVKIANLQAQKSLESWSTMKEYENSFPLRDPRPLISQSGETCLQQINYSEGSFVPLRVITAIPAKEQSDLFAKSMNTQISSFIAQTYPCGQISGIKSDVGAWKPGFDNEDSTIRTVFEHIKGEPIIVLSPRTYDGASKMKFTLWASNLGESDQPAFCYEIGWLDTYLYKKYLGLEVIKEYLKIQEKLSGETEQSIKEKDLEAILTIISKIDSLMESSNNTEESTELITQLLKDLVIPVSLRNDVDSKYDKSLAQLYSVMIGMYADAYYLKNYGFMPKLPCALKEMNSLPEQFIPEIYNFYLALLDACQEEGILPSIDCCELEYSLMESLKAISQSNLPFSTGHADRLLLKLISYNDKSNIISQERLERLYEKGKQFRSLDNQLTL